MDNLKLKKMLNVLIKNIYGDFFVGDGALLGLIRNGNLIPWDNDIDIYLLPNSEIDFEGLRECGLEKQDYYMDTKIYDPQNTPNNLNSWKEYVSYRKYNDCRYLNRCEILVECKKNYYDEKIKPIFTLPYIDVYKLKFFNGRLINF